MAHKLKFWKEGHARRKLGNSSLRARARLRLFASIVIFSSSVLAKVREKLLSVFFFFFAEPRLDLRVMTI